MKALEEQQSFLKIVAVRLTLDLQCLNANWSKIIGIFHGCMMWIENSVTRSLVGIMRLVE